MTGPPGGCAQAVRLLADETTSLLRAPPCWLTPWDHGRRRNENQESEGAGTNNEREMR
jgi:hypothetical protein